MARPLAPAVLLVALLGCSLPVQDSSPLVPTSPEAGSEQAAELEPALHFEPAIVQAGARLEVDVILEDFDIDGALVLYGATSDEVVFEGIVSALSDDRFGMAFYFGLLAQGPQPWTLFNEGGAAQGTFEVEPLEDLQSLEPGLGAGSTEPGSLRDFAAWSLSVPEGHYVMTRVVPSTDSPVSPLQWLLAEDGVDVLASEQDELLIWHSPEERTIFLRVQDLASTGGTEFGVDLALIETGLPQEQLESEPNDSAESWQDLGVLDVGLHRLAGSAATAGHDDDSEPNGDLDVFRFRVAEDTRVSFELSWEGEQDFDAVLYRDEGAETQLGFASEQAISLQMASTAQPERAELELSADESYLLMVANWWGEPEAPWELLLNVYPGSFP